MKKIALILSLIILMSMTFVISVSAETITQEQWNKLSIHSYYKKNDISVIYKNPITSTIRYFTWNMFEGKIMTPELNTYGGSYISLQWNDTAKAWDLLDNTTGVVPVSNFKENPSSIVYANMDLFIGSDTSTVFFSQTQIPQFPVLSNQLQSLPQNLQPNQLPVQAFGHLIPLVLGLAVSWLALRKAYSFLSGALNQA